MIHLFFEDRKKQLEEQERIDKNLNNIKNECPKTVSEYLLIQRDITRLQQRHLMKCSVFELYSGIKKQMKVNEKITKDILRKPINCENLKNIISRD
jgi:hypothetical protein